MLYLCTAAAIIVTIPTAVASHPAIANTLYLTQTITVKP